MHRARRRGPVQQVCRRADNLRLRDHAVDGTRPRGAPTAGHRHIGGFVSLGRRVGRCDFGRHRHPAVPVGFQPCHVGVGALRDFSKGRRAGGRELRGQDHLRLIHRMWSPGQVASTDRLDGVKGRGILCPPNRRGAGGLVHHHNEVMAAVVGGIIRYATPYLSDTAETVVKLNAASKAAALQFEKRPRTCPTWRCGLVMDCGWRMSRLSAATPS